MIAWFFFFVAFFCFALALFLWVLDTLDFMWKLFWLFQFFLIRFVLSAVVWYLLTSGWWVVDVCLLAGIFYLAWYFLYPAPSPAFLPLESLPLRLENDPDLQFMQDVPLENGDAVVFSTRRMVVEGEVPLSISAGFKTARLRRRARWVRVLERILGGRCGGAVGAFVRGRWIPDLPAAQRSSQLNVLLSTIPDGAKVHGGGLVENPESVAPMGDNDAISASRFKSQLWYLLELSDGTLHVVFPDLVCRLGSYSLFRERDQSLLDALRARARDWCKRELPSWAWSYAMPPAVLFAWRGTTVESEVSTLLTAGGVPAAPTLPSKQGQ